MQRFGQLLTRAVLCGAFLVAQPLKAAEPVPPRFSVEHIDRNADPKKDFARFAFGKWIENNTIPSDKSRWGGFDELGQFNWLALKSILEETAASKPKNAMERKVVDFFVSATNTAAINAAGLKPVSKDLARINSIKSMKDLASEVARLHDIGVPALFSIGVAADQKNSTMNALYARQGGMSLPSKDYYFSDQFQKIRDSFVEHIAKMLTMAGANNAMAQQDAARIFNLEKSLAENARTPVELRDTIANYNKMPTDQLAKTISAFPLDRYLKARGITGKAAEEIVVGQPKFFEGLQAQLAARPIDDWRIYLRYQLLRDAAPYLAEEFENEHFRFYSTVMRGTPEMEPRWQRAARAVDNGLGESLGQLYVAKRYPAEAKERMDEMIKNIRAVMRERLQKLDWMTEPTRQKALAKFDRFEARIGHPDKWRDYSKIPIKRDNYFANVTETAKFEIKRRNAKLGKPVDKYEWLMTPPTVNAYFHPLFNQIVFPAGILQPPFFDFTLDDAVNYGAIGAVIGHEITHGFDDQGRNYDADGNISDWWTEQDAANFKARAQKLVEQYNEFEALPGLKVNGALSLGENIADLGGVSIAFEAYQRSIANKRLAPVDGFTPEQRFFLSWAQQWRTAYREDALRRQVTVGPHSPGQFRAVGPLRNMQEFFDAFGIKQGDPMYRAPQDRAKIW